MATDPHFEFIANEIEKIVRQGIDPDTRPTPGNIFRRLATELSPINQYAAEKTRDIARECDCLGKPGDDKLRLAKIKELSRRISRMARS